MSSMALPEDHDDILGNFLTNEYLTDFFSLERSRKVMSIVGPPDQSGAANKKALNLYNNAKKIFNFYSSVESPDGPDDILKILSSILKDVQGEHKGDTIAPLDEIKQAQQKVEQALKKKRYIVLITGLGEAATWDSIKSAFPDEGHNINSRVIITTCRWDVALKCSSGQSDLIYRLRSGTSDKHEAPNLEVHDKAQMEITAYVEELPENLLACVFFLSTIRDAHEYVFERESMVRKWKAEEFTSANEHLFDDLLNRGWIIQQGSSSHGPTYMLDPMFLSCLRNVQRKLMTGGSFELRPDSNFVNQIALLDILVCQLNDGDLQKLGQMSNLRKLVLALAGIQTKKMVITKDSFLKLQVFEIDCHVPWVTFEDGSMPELRCLRLKLYAGPKDKTPSGTNHLKNLDELSLNHAKEYEESAYVQKTTSTMEEEAQKRAKPTTLIINGEAKFPKLRLTDSDGNTDWVKWKRKTMLFFYDYVFTLLFPLAIFLRAALAKMPKWILHFAIPLLALICYHYIILLARIAPWALMAASWLARRVLPILVLFAIHAKLAGEESQWANMIVPVFAYKMVGLLVAVYPSFSKAILVSCTTLVWSVCALLRIVLVYILTPLWYTISTLLIYVAPVICALIFSNYLAGKTKKMLLFILPVLALPFYFFPSQSYSAVLWLPYGVTKWLIWGL